MADFITTNLGDDNPNDLHAGGTSIVTKMTANVLIFPSPPEPLTEIQDLLDDLAPYLVERAELSTNERKLRNKIMEEIVKKLHRNGLYVLMLFPDDEIKQLLSGYPGVRTRQLMTGPPDPPYNVRVRRGKIDGQLIANCRKHRGTKSVNVKVHNEKTNETYMFNNPSGTGIKLDGLVRGDSYIISIQAVGVKGNSNYVSASSIIVG